MKREIPAMGAGMTWRNIRPSVMPIDVATSTFLGPTESDALPLSHCPKIPIPSMHETAKPVTIGEKFFSLKMLGR